MNAATVVTPALPTSEALDAATKAAAKEMKAAQTECVRALAVALRDHKNGYAEPVGTMVSGIWIPDPSQFFRQAGIGDELTRALQADSVDGGSHFRAKKLCKSWRYCWWLATAYIEGAHGLPTYVTRAAQTINFEKIRNERATDAAKAAAKVARALPEFKAAQRHEKIEEKLASIEARIAGLERTIADYAKKTNRANTLLKKARAEHKRALRRREAKS